MKAKSKAKLSNNVLQMKFMKRTAAQEQEEQALIEQKKQIDDEHWYLQTEEKKTDSNVGQVILEPSYTIFDGLLFGRFSFNGYNPQVEKLMNANDDKNETEVSDEEKEINDDDMAEKFKENSVNMTLHKKFNKRFFGKVNESKVKRLGTK